MQSRIATLFAIVRGRTVEVRWAVNRFFFSRLPLQTLLDVRTCKISQSRLQRLVRMGLDAGFRVPAPDTRSYESLQRTFLAICDRLYQTEQLLARRRARKQVKFQLDRA